MSVKPSYIMQVDLSGRCCVVVGGGKVATRKIASLLMANAQVNVISLDFTDEIKGWMKDERIQGVCRAYQTRDLDGTFLAIAATSNKDINQQVYEDAARCNVLVNVVDQPDQSSFWNVSTFSRGRLHIAVSTSGASPILAERIRYELEEQYSEEYEIYVDFLYEFRQLVKQHVADARTRHQMHKELLEQDIIMMIRTGQFASFREQVLNRFGG